MNTEIKKYIEEKAKEFNSFVFERKLPLYFEKYNIIGGDKNFKFIQSYKEMSED